MSSLVGASEPVPLILLLGLSWLLVPAVRRRLHYPVIGHLLPRSLLLGCAPLAISPMLWVAEKKYSVLIRCITLLSLLRPNFRMATTAALSHKHLIAFPCHKATPITTGRSSFAVMWIGAQVLGNFSWNHSPVDSKAPHPHDPGIRCNDPSVLCWDNPFHHSPSIPAREEECPQRRSDLNPLFSRSL